MFVGAVNSTVRSYLATNADVFTGRHVVVGCSGNFTLESVIAQYARPAGIHSNDVSLYSCTAGRWLAGQEPEYTVASPEFDWLPPMLTTRERKVAGLMVLLDMLEFEKRNNPHRVRMWNLYRENFTSLLDKTAEKLSEVGLKLDSFYAGDVFDHFLRFAGDKRAIFCCYAPTYAGGYERMYKRLDAIIHWDQPEYQLLDDKRRDALLAWMMERNFLWYDDRAIDGMQPEATFKSGRNKAVHLYANVARSAYVADYPPHVLPKLPLAGCDLELTLDAQVRLCPIKTSDLARYKDAFLAKNIDHGQGMWAFSVQVDEKVIGFLEFKSSDFARDQVYMMADFAVPGTRYKRISKLILQLSVAEETKRLLERVSVVKKRGISTTAFTDRSVSMKYRGVFDLDKRGETASGQKFLNYSAQFNHLSWQETYRQWLTRHGSVKS